jgi:hypothetical protein
MQIGGVTKGKPKRRGKTAPRPQIRQKKSDRMISGKQSKEAIMCDLATAPLSRLADEMDRKWGIDVLPELVSPEMAAKYGSAVAKFLEAMDEGKPDVVAARVGVCMRGLQAMDAQATEKGAQRASTDVWQVELEGQVFGILKEGRSWREAKKEMPDVKLYTMREVAVALSFYTDHALGIMMEDVKEQFPESDIVGVKTKGSMEGEIPF